MKDKQNAIEPLYRGGLLYHAPELLAALEVVVKDANLEPGETKACSVRMSTVRRAVEAIAQAKEGEYPFEGIMDGPEMMPIEGEVFPWSLHKGGE